MRKIFLIPLLYLLIGGSFAWAQPTSNLNLNRVSPELLERLNQFPNTYHEVTILLLDRVDPIAMHQRFIKRNLPVDDRARQVVTALKAKAAQTQGPILNWLQTHPGVEAGSIKPMWITNEIHANLKAEAIATLSQRSDIDWMHWEEPDWLLDLDKACQPASPKSVGGHEPAHDIINATDMWALGYTGIGTRVLIIDSGVDGTHPALSRNYRGNFAPSSVSWFNNNIGSQKPRDCIDHGSHVSGIVAGMALETRDTIGVAFNALWMGSPAIDGDGNGNVICPQEVTDEDALQWALDPDNNSQTTDDMPHVINGSYGGPANSSHCSNSLFKLRVDAVEAAGIAFALAAGNEGNGDSTISSIGSVNSSLVNTFTVGATNFNSQIAGFSSRGPSWCGGGGSLEIKPEVVAPGVSIRSSVPGNAYEGKMGTSMSAPQVAGALLLLKEAFPTLSGTDLKLALYNSAVDLGPTGEDNIYGKGMIDVLAAYNYLINQGNTPAAVSRAKDAVLLEVQDLQEVNCSGNVSPRILVENNGKTNLSSLKIDYTYSNGTAGNITWTGNLSPGSQTLIDLTAESFPVGNYDLEINLAEVDGQSDYYNLDNYARLNFTIQGDDLPTITSPGGNVTSIACFGGSALLEATSPLPGRSIVWFDAPSDGNVIGEGNIYVTPMLFNPTIFYAEAQGNAYVGLPDNSVGQNFPSLSQGSYLEFDAYTDFTLKSVLVYPASSDVRRIQLFDEEGTLLGSTPALNMPQGEVRITLNFEVPRGTGYRLQVADGVNNLMATLTDFQFPFTLDGVVSITGSNNTFYNHFYDWEINYSSACGRASIPVSVLTGSVDAKFTANKSVVDLDSDPSISFTNTSTGSSSVEWRFGDGNGSTDENPTHMYTHPGTYRVGLSAFSSTGCIDSDTMTIEVVGTPVGLNNTLADWGEIRVYPNPSPGAFSLSFDLIQPLPAEIEIVDLLGQRVWYREKEVYQQGELSFNLQQQPNGMYLLRVNSPRGTRILKLVKSDG